MRQFFRNVCLALAMSARFQRDTPKHAMSFHQRLNYRARWLLASCFRPAATASWFALVNDAAMQPLQKDRFPLACKPAREYMSSRWSFDDRVLCLKETYQLILANPFLCEALSNPEGRVLAAISLPGSGDVEIRVHHDGCFRKEGELVMTVFADELGGAMTSVAMSFQRQSDGTLACHIGAIQGHESLDSFRATTKAMYGLRPKSLAVFAAQEVARSLGAKALFGAGSRIHMYRTKCLFYLPNVHRVLFDYDTFWTELGGTLQQTGWFQLPLATDRRTKDEIKPNKRSMYAKRYAMMDELSLQVSRVLSGFVPDDQDDELESERSREHAMPSLPNVRVVSDMPHETLPLADRFIPRAGCESTPNAQVDVATGSAG